MYSATKIKILVAIPQMDGIYTDSFLGMAVISEKMMELYAYMELYAWYFERY